MEVSALEDRDAGKKVSNPFNTKGDGVSLMAIYFLTSVPVYHNSVRTCLLALKSVFASRIT
jgi:hypothetical protein